MRLIGTMEENRDTAGWGVMGTVTALILYSDWMEQVGFAALVAASGMLGSLITKRIFNYLEGKVTNWWEKRKTKSNNQ